MTKDEYVNKLFGNGKDEFEQACNDNMRSEFETTLERLPFSDKIQWTDSGPKLNGIDMSVYFMYPSIMKPFEIPTKGN